MFNQESGVSSLSINLYIMDIVKKPTIFGISSGTRGTLYLFYDEEAEILLNRADGKKVYMHRGELDSFLSKAKEIGLKVFYI